MKKSKPTPYVSELDQDVDGFNKGDSVLVIPDEYSEEIDEYKRTHSGVTPKQIPDTHKMPTATEMSMRPTYDDKVDNDIDLEIIKGYNAEKLLVCAMLSGSYECIRNVAVKRLGEIDAKLMKMSKKVDVISIVNQSK